MKETTRDFLAVELMVIATVMATATVLCFLLNNVGIAAPITATSVTLYFFRWLWWAVRHCRSRPQLHVVVGRLLCLTGIMVSLGGALLLVAGLRGILLGILALSFFFAGLILVVWSHKEFGRRETPPQSSPAAPPVLSA